MESSFQGCSHWCPFSPGSDPHHCNPEAERLSPSSDLKVSFTPSSLPQMNGGKTEAEASRNYFTWSGRDMKGSSISSKELLDFGSSLSRRDLNEAGGSCATCWNNKPPSRYHKIPAQISTKDRNISVAYHNTYCGLWDSVPQRREAKIGFQPTLELTLEIYPLLVLQIWN